MKFLVGILLIIALSAMPAPESSEASTKGSITVKTGTEGTHIGLKVKSDTNPSVILHLGGDPE